MSGSGSGSRSRSRGKLTAVPYKRAPPSIPKDELIQIHGFQFEIISIVKSNHLFKVDVGQASFTGKPLTAIECHTYEQVDDCFSRGQKNSPETFQPIAAYKHGEKFLLLGNFTGETFGDWVTLNNSCTWTNATGGGSGGNLGDLTDVTVSIGRQLTEIVIKNHKMDRFLGNIREQLCISDDHRVVFIPNYNIPSYDDLSFTDGLRKDIEDLRWFINTLYEPYRVQYPNHEPCRLFYGLFPYNLSYQADIEKLKEVSYLICNNPLFWDLNKRYRFAKIVKEEIYDKRKRRMNENFTTYIPLDNGLSDVGDWWEVIRRLIPNSTFQILHTYGAANDGRYFKKHGLLAFLRNAFEHYQQVDPMMTLDDVDKEIIRLFPNVYQKIYLAIANPNRETYIRLDLLLEENNWN